jgi:predicted transglutaminase-like cysteine proteinase
MTCVVLIAKLLCRRLASVVRGGSRVLGSGIIVASLVGATAASAADPARPLTAGLPEPSRLGRHVSYAPNDRAPNDLARDRNTAKLPLGTSLTPEHATTGIATTGHFMRIFGQANPPYGFVQFCDSFPKECLSGDAGEGRFDATPERLAELDAINRTINANIEPVTDLDLYGVPEWWAIPKLRADGTGKGDCEDYALLKRQILIKSGWPVSSVLMTVVRDEKGDGHAVLTARTAQGDFILDNKAIDVRLWSKTGYKFVMRQSYLNVKVWMSLDPKETMSPGPMAAAKPQR